MQLERSTKRKESELTSILACLEILCLDTIRKQSVLLDPFDKRGIQLGGFRLYVNRCYICALLL